MSTMETSICDKASLKYEQINSLAYEALIVLERPLRRFFAHQDQQRVEAQVRQMLGMIDKLLSQAEGNEELFGCFEVKDQSRPAVVTEKKARTIALLNRLKDTIHEKRLACPLNGVALFLAATNGLSYASNAAQLAIPLLGAH